MIDDLISREEVLKLPQRRGYAVNGWETYIRVSDIEELPPSQPRVKCIATITFSKEELEEIVKEQVEEIKELLPQKGKWIYGESEIGNDGYYCSVCGNFVPWKYDEYDIDFIKEFLFCPKCGADMRSEAREYSEYGKLIAKGIKQGLRGE